MNLKRQSAGNGARIATTAIIWGFATGMIAICIPIIDITDDAIILPLAVVLGTSGSTVAVWLSGGHYRHKIDDLSNKFQVLQERIMDLETICSTQELEIGRKFEQLEPKDRHHS